MDKNTLKKMTVATLKEQAKKIPDVKSLSSMKKDELIELILKHEGTGAKSPKPAKSSKTAKPAKKSAAIKQDGPLNKSEVKQRIRALKQEKNDAISSQDRARARQCTKQIHDYKRWLRKMAGAKKRSSQSDI